MDVNKTSFYPLLLDILDDISHSYFVSLDLELSGVPTKQSWAERGPGRPSLQQRYEEIKIAAEKYQILQIGLTCVREDVESNAYICHPYNFEISPLIEENGLDVERDFTFHTGAVNFLQGVAYDFSKPFRIGIPYLSRDETKQARQRFDARQKRGAIADLQIKETDVEALALLQRVRKEIDLWLSEDRRSAPDYLNVGPPAFDTSPDDSHSSPEFTRFEKRLVHQLVRAEYPELVTISRRRFIQIVRFDAEREARIKAERKAELNVRIGRQKGFRWVIEALLGNNISGLDLKLCAHDAVTGESIVADMDGYRGRFHNACYLMRERPRVIVGHNCFLDLVYLYRTFIGELPSTFEEFTQLLHKSWPTVVDTKYMATHNCGDINPASSLEEIARQLEPVANEASFDVVDKLHNKYQDVESFHEAGFDSLLTAQVAIRLSKKLQAEGIDVDDSDGSGGVSVPNAYSSSGVVGAAMEKSKDAVRAAFASLGLNGTSPNTANGDTTASTVATSHADMDFVPSDANANWQRDGDPSLGLRSQDDISSSNPRRLYLPSNAELRGIQGGMPRFGGGFWQVYGNRLRVFGTEESVLILNQSA